jgi:hypothetical protein
MIRENIKMSGKDSLRYYQMKQNKPWFDEGCSILLSKETRLTAVVTGSK